MSRIRSIHPGIWTDEAFMGLSPHGRLLLMGIWTEAWDDGVFEWKPLTLKARIFPADNIDVADLLMDLVQAGVIARLDSVAKQPGVIRNFQKYQRPKKPNSSGMLPDEWLDYVGARGTDAPSGCDGGEPVRNQFGTSSEKSSQMEDGGGKRGREKERQEGREVAPANLAFAGKVIRLKADAFERWRKSYPNVRDMVAELTKADDYYVDHPPPDGKWFFAASKWLARANGERTKASEAEELAYRGAL